MKKLNTNLLFNDSVAPGDGLIYWGESEINTNILKMIDNRNLEFSMIVKTWSDPQKYYLIRCKNVKSGPRLYTNKDVAGFKYDGDKFQIYVSHELSIPFEIITDEVELFEIEDTETSLVV